jgi:hypothetical protein
MYRPRYCAECGHRIERERWRFWHSRQFCQTCARVLERRRRIRLSVLLIVSFALGVGIGRFSMRDPAPPPSLWIERLASPMGVTPLPENGGAVSSSSTTNAPRITICGALTKRGTPCRRRVREGERCWQHRQGATERELRGEPAAPAGRP